MILEDSFGRESSSPPPVKPMPRSVFSVCGRTKPSSRHVLNHLLQQVLLPVQTMLQRLIKLKRVHLKVVLSVIWVPNSILVFAQTVENSVAGCSISHWFSLSYENYSASCNLFRVYKLQIRYSISELELQPTCVLCEEYYLSCFLCIIFCLFYEAKQ